jgi:two-component system response regulator HydG
MQARVLIVDDDPEMADMVGDYLESRGYLAERAVGGKAAIATLRKKPFDAVITDLRMEEMDGLDVLRSAHAVDADLPVLVMTAFGSIDGALEAVRLGAFHYFTKPFKLEETTVWLERAMTDRGLRRENRQLRRVIDDRAQYLGLLGKSAPMRMLYDVLERVSATAAPVLVTGESGTGKELVAAALHLGSPRAQGPFVAINCAAISETLLESELFGHAKGAFTGAFAAHKGLFEEADGGTLLLDEIGEMPLGLQAKLLRVVEQASVRPVGGSADRAVDVRIVAATNRDLAAAVKERTFREDLYYRLNVVPVHLPPLRARREDIPALVEHFAARCALEHPELPRRELTPELVRRLAELPWPGNVRELKNIVERLWLLARGTRIDVRDLARVVSDPLPEGMAAFAAEIVTLRTMNRRYIEWVLERVGGNKVRAAQLLGVDASTIYRTLARDE